MIAEYFVSLPVKFIKEIINFFSFWYLTSSKNFWQKEVSFIKGIENDIGLLINLRLMFQPIFGDYSYMGRVIGPIFRTGRILFGFIFILLSLVFMVIMYLIWIILPLLTFLMIFLNLMVVF